MKKQKYLKSSEVAEMLGVKEHTLAVWRCYGKNDLPFIKLGHTVRYKQKDVEKWLKRKEA